MGNKYEIISKGVENWNHVVIAVRTVWLMEMKLKLTSKKLKVYELICPLW